MTDGDTTLGARIQFYRGKRTKAVIAGLAGISPRYLTYIEDGDKTPSVGVLQKLAKVLGVPVSTLLGTPTLQERDAIHPIADRMQAALMGYASQPDEPLELTALRRRVETAWAAWQGEPHRFTSLSAVLPDLTTDVLFARTNAAHPDAAREASKLAVDLYFLLRSFLKRIGKPDLSLMVADRALVAAFEADDPVRVAAARWNLAQILNADGQHEGAKEVSRVAVEQLRAALPESVDAKALEGALWLIAAVATQRGGGRAEDTWAAREILRTHAAEAARITGETNTAWTVFGPTNVSLHCLSVEAGAGEATEALRIADGIDVSRSPSFERRTTFYLEVASVYDQQRNDEAVFAHLQAAESTGPEDLRYNAISRALVRALLKRSRPLLRPQVAGLATRVGLVDF